MKNFVVIFLFLIYAMPPIQASDKPHITLKGKNKSNVIISHDEALISPFLQGKIKEGSIYLLYPDIEETNLRHIQDYTTRRYQIDLQSQGKLGNHNIDLQEELSKYLNNLDLNELILLSHFAFSFFPDEEIPHGLLDPWTEKIKQNKAWGIQEVCDLVGETHGTTIFNAYVTQNPPSLEMPIAIDPSQTEESSTENDSKKTYGDSLKNIKNYIVNAWHNISFNKSWQKKITNETIGASLAVALATIVIIYRGKILAST